MDILKTGLGISKTIKNVSRFREILTVFAKHGFDELIIASKLDRLIPNFVLPRSRKKNDTLDYDVWRSVGSRLRKSFEELGPSFIKVGQLLSSREDLFDPAFIAELKELQDNAAAVNFTEMKQVIEESLGKKIEDVFEIFDQNPIGVASIGIVYKAQLKESKKAVVVKVRRPHIKQKILNDFEIIDFIVLSIERISKEVQYLGLSRAVNDFFKSIQLELNFVIEANNNRKISASLKSIDTDGILVIPEVYRDLSSEAVLVMDYIKGIPFNEIKDISAHEGLEAKITKCVDLFMHNMLVDGFFHADLHGGNFFLLEDGNVGLIDFGLVGVLGKKNRTSLVAILYALLNNNYENLVYEFLDVAEFDKVPDHDKMIRDIRDALSVYIGLSVKEMDVTALTRSIVSTLSRHEVYLPRDWFIIFRALMTLDGVGKSLNMELNIFETIERNIKNIMGDLVSKDALIEELVWLGRDSINSVRIIPRHINWALKELSKNGYSLDVSLRDVDKNLNLLVRSVFFLGFMFLGSTFFISGAFLVKGIVVSSFSDIPVLAYVCFGLCMITLFRASLLFKVK